MLIASSHTPLAHRAVKNFNPDEAADREDVTGGGVVVYFRHARAELGADDKDSQVPGWWKSADPALTRQLDDLGHQQAYKLGEALRHMELPVDKVLSSEFRRTMDTAEQMGVGEPVPTADLTPLVYGDEDLEERIERRLNEAPEAGEVTVLVGHGHVTERFANLEEGDAAVFRPGAEEPEFLGYVPYEQWLVWGRA